MGPTFPSATFVSLFITIALLFVLKISQLDALQCTAFDRTRVRQHRDGGLYYYRSSWQAPDVLFLQKNTTTDTVGCSFMVTAYMVRYKSNRSFDRDNLRVVASFKQIEATKCTKKKNNSHRDHCHYWRSESIRGIWTSKEAHCCCFTDHCNDLRSDRFAFNMTAIREYTSVDLGEIADDNRRAPNATFEDEYQAKYESYVLDLEI